MCVEWIHYLILDTLIPWLMWRHTATHSLQWHPYWGAKLQRWLHKATHDSWTGASSNLHKRLIPDSPSNPAVTCSRHYGSAWSRGRNLAPESRKNNHTNASERKSQHGWSWPNTNPDRSTDERARPPSRRGGDGKAKREEEWLPAWGVGRRRVDAAHGIA